MRLMFVEIYMLFFFPPRDTSNCAMQKKICATFNLFMWITLQGEKVLARL